MGMLFRDGKCDYLWPDTGSQVVKVRHVFSFYSVDCTFVMCVRLNVSQTSGKQLYTKKSEIIQFEIIVILNDIIWWHSVY